ncbi:MAG: AraC family transcriptional regulator [Epsilonproteobacteria bacterium]|nr:AraC family transcriptional regulator [Campylobacterota bacterium]
MKYTDEVLLENKESKIILYKDICTVELFLNEPFEKHSTILSDNLMVILLNGQRVMQTEQKSFLGSAGDIFFVRSGTYVLSEVFDDVPRYGALIFKWNDSFIYEFIKNSHLDLSYIGQKEDAIFQIIPNEMLRYASDTFISLFLCREQIDESIIKHKLEEMLLLLYNSDKDDYFKSFLKLLSFDKYIDIKAKVEENLSPHDTIGEISNKLGIPPNDFRKEFTKIYGTVPQKWLIKRRLEMAKLLLMYDDKNISEVCTEVGYANLSWFIQQFKKEFGLTPKQFQKQQKL